jgi:hypothetical protein
VSLRDFDSSVYVFALDHFEGSSVQGACRKWSGLCVLCTGVAWNGDGFVWGFERRTDKANPLASIFLDPCVDRFNKLWGRPELVVMSDDQKIFHSRLTLRYATRARFGAYHKYEAGEPGYDDREVCD